ncbi:MAG: glycosyltransferase family 2 protein [Rectinemataceae bacterium]|jgi:GT2 family glycosyltransferase
MKTSIIFIIFNRADTTKQVFEAIRAAKPRQLFVVADGPRTTRPGEAEKCTATRAVIDTVDWDCEVHKEYSDSNLGCRKRVSSGITWAFGIVDRAVILEDDCVPSPSFFKYCSEMLDRYEYDERVMVVSGDNHLFGQKEPNESYYFSRYPHCWGWATWKRAWEKCDLEMKQWPEVRRRRLFDQYFWKTSERYYWKSLFQYVYDGNIDTWDYQWVYSIWANSGLSIVPKRNLVRNIGFHAEATHTKGDSAYASLKAEVLDFPLVHPQTVIVSVDRDELEASLRVKHSGSLRYPLNKYASSMKRLVKKMLGYGKTA